jgi:hypothetical protein
MPEDAVKIKAGWLLASDYRLGTGLRELSFWCLVCGQSVYLAPKRSWTVWWNQINKYNLKFTCEHCSTYCQARPTFIVALEKETIADPGFQYFLERIIQGR